MTVRPVRFDPFAYEIHEDPHPVYRRLRDEAPAYVDPDHGFWALSRDDDIRAALNDPATFSSSGGVHSGNVRGFSRLPVGFA